MGWLQPLCRHREFACSICNWCYYRVWHISSKMLPDFVPRKIKLKLLDFFSLSFFHRVQFSCATCARLHLRLVAMQCGSIALQNNVLHEIGELRVREPRANNENSPFYIIAPVEALGSGTKIITKPNGSERWATNQNGKKRQFELHGQKYRWKCWWAKEGLGGQRENNTGKTEFTKRIKWLINGNWHRIIYRLPIRWINSQLNSALRMKTWTLTFKSSEHRTYCAVTHAHLKMMRLFVFQIFFLYLCVFRLEFSFR